MPCIVASQKNSETPIYISDTGSSCLAARRDRRRRLTDAATQLPLHLLSPTNKDHKLAVAQRNHIGVQVLRFSAADQPCAEANTAFKVALGRITSLVFSASAMK